MAEYRAFTSKYKFPSFAHPLIPVDLIAATDHTNAYSASLERETKE